MTNRAGQITWRAAVGALLATCLSSACLAVGADRPADAASSAQCLSGPKGAAPQGQRWYYRVERGTKQHCWYTRAESARNVATKTSAPEPVDAADNPTPSPAPLQPAVANARAEAAPSAFPPPVLPSPPLAAPAMTAAEPGRTLADRLADHPNAGQPTPSLPQSAALPTPKAASDTPQTSLWMLLAGIGSALALGGGGFAAFTWLTRPRRIERPEMHWPAAQAQDETYDDAPLLAVGAENEVPTQWDDPPMNWVRIAREESEKRGEDIEHLLSRRTRSA